MGFFTYPKRIDFHETLVVERKDIPIKNKIAKEAAMSFGITEEQLEELGFVGYKWIAFAGAEPFGGNFLIVTWCPLKSILSHLNYFSECQLFLIRLIFR